MHTYLCRAAPVALFSLNLYSDGRGGLSASWDVFFARGGARLLGFGIVSGNAAQKGEQRAKTPLAP